MLNYFIMVIDDLISKEDCEQYIEWIEHYISHSVMLKESDKLHDRDHFTMNFNNHYSYDLLSGDNLSVKFAKDKNWPVIGSCKLDPLAMSL